MMFILILVFIMSHYLFMRFFISHYLFEYVLVVCADPSQLLVSLDVCVSLAMWAKCCNCMVSWT